MASSKIDCYPYFHNLFDDVANVVINSGCGIGGDGNVGCDPESMRASAEAQLAALGYPRSLSLEAYTLGRYMHSEVGSGTIEERVAVGEAAVNRARREYGIMGSVNDLLLYRQNPKSACWPACAANRGKYGPIHGVGTGTSTAPYGRWAATSRDPSLKSLLIADLIVSGKSFDFSNGADDQDGPEAWINQGQASLTGYVQRLASKGKYWVGPLPGVDHWHTFLQFTPGPLVTNKAELLQRGIEALTLPAQRPQWDPNLPVCSKPIGASAAKIFAAVFGFLVGAWVFNKGMLRKAGQ